MRTYSSLFLVLLLALVSNVNAGGILVADALSDSYFTILSDSTVATVNDQVASFRSRQWYVNSTGDTATVEFAYPLPVGASSTAVRWLIDGEWFDASFSADAQDSTFNGEGPQMNNQLHDYLGENYTYLPINADVAPWDSIAVEIEFVQLLPYELGEVQLTYLGLPGQFITGSMSSFYFQFDLFSQREIIDVSLCYNVLSDFTSFSDDNDYDAPLSVIEWPREQDDQSVKFFPNPSTGIINLPSQFALEDIESIRVFNSSMQVVHLLNSLGNGVKQLDLSMLPEGVYLIEIKTKNGTYQGKVMIFS